MAAMGLSALAKCRTTSSTRAFRRKYSGARPPGTTSESYVAGSTLAKVALTVKRWPGFSE
eukprot:357-Eustigmatos_ZCMA.PRE.1